MHLNYFWYLRLSLWKIPSSIEGTFHHVCMQLQKARKWQKVCLQNGERFDTLSSVYTKACMLLQCSL
jgi:hypothetical protein